MGVVMRQGIKYSIVTYVFMIVSIAAAVLLFPNQRDLYGTLNFFVDSALLLAPILMLGSSIVSVKFYPEIKERYGSGNVLLSTGLVAIITSITVVTVIGALSYAWLQSYYADKSQLMNVGDNIWIFIPLITAVCIHNFLILHISNYRLIAVPKLIQSSWRVSLPLIFILVWWNKVSVLAGIWLVIGHFVLAIVALLYYLHGLDKVKIRFNSKTFNFFKRQDVLTFGAFAMLTSLGSSLAFRLDSFMVTSILDTTNNGTYSIGSRISSVIAVPAAAILGIAIPIISSAMKNKKLDEVHSLYRRSSEVLTIAGVVMLSGLAVIVMDIFSVISNGPEMVASGAIYVVAIIALGRFIDMITSVNSEIISLSEAFRYNLYFLLMLATMNITLNIVLIPKMGIKGAALATLISLFMFNSMKVIFIKVRFNMWPFSWKTLLIIGIGITSVSIVNFLVPMIKLPLLVGICIKGAFVMALIFSALYFPKISPDFNYAVNVALRRAKKFI